MPERNVRNDPIFGRNLKAAMKACGVNATWLAGQAGVKAGQVYRWRRGELPDELRLPKIAHALQTTIADLYPDGSAGPTVAKPATVTAINFGRPVEPENVRVVYGLAMADLSHCIASRQPIEPDRAMGWIARIFEAAMAAEAIRRAMPSGSGHA